MAFAGMNVLAIIAAGIAGWIAGAVWYGVLGRPWMAALGRSLEEMKAKGPPYGPMILAFVADIIMAWMLAGVVGHLGPGQVTIRNAVISGLFIWFGFILTTMAVNNAFGGRKAMLTIIDAGHWLLVMIVIGVIIGAFGV